LTQIGHCRIDHYRIDPGIPPLNPWEWFDCFDELLAYSREGMTAELVYQ
jgi:hypothetical protein